MHTGENVGGVALDFHAASAAVALLAAPEFARDEGPVDFQNCVKSGCAQDDSGCKFGKKMFCVGFRSASQRGGRYNNQKPQVLPTRFFLRPLATSQILLA